MKKGKASVAVSCPAKAKTSCVGKLVLKTAKKVSTGNGTKKIVTVGSGPFSIPAGSKIPVVVSVSSAGKTP